jgi:uncharacterized ferritin-like protein (DUF455 family)
MTFPFDLARDALAAASVDAKLECIDRLGSAMVDGAALPAPTFSPGGILQRGVPAHPLMVAPQDVPQRKPSTPAGRAALLHAVTHIEFSAIDLALDHALRFPGFPVAYYADWLGVAIEEAHHFRLLRGHLQTLGHDYGDFPVHDSLWRMAERTAGDALARMALVPRLLEARGLDATPTIQEKLAATGDKAAAQILDVILRDEVGHVGLGDKWFRMLCVERGLEPEPTFRALIVEYGAPWPLAPMNREARLRAGFRAEELDRLTNRHASD